MQNLKITFFRLMVVLSTVGFTACDDNNIDPSTEKENSMSLVIPQYVNHTVIATYRSLADATIDLYEAIDHLAKNKTTANLNTVAEAWISSRTYWEKSEAFLFGAVADFGIDPHIDTWPLDEVAFLKVINNSDFIESMDAEDGDVWAANHLGFALLGFHGIEYILFEEGKTKDINKITANELIYARAVAGDLRNQCIRLEAAWAGIDNISAEKKQLIENLDLQIMPSNSPLSYGENMLLAGKAGSTYRTVTQAAIAIIAGCINISDEVGEVKIGTAHNKDDVNYIESPYSFNSKVDFIDNIRSIENAYLGGVEGHRGASISDYIKSVNSDLDNTVKNAMTHAIAKIDAIPYPFAKNYASAEAGTALKACQDLTVALEKVKSVLEE
ncbi:hypothetical protein AGMMS50262_02830 [Bacteroidia bacterium]|nr:hypothetical protein AGMMS50262_02830 [Bacteroidia bacterium]